MIQLTSVPFMLSGLINLVYTYGRNKLNDRTHHGLLHRFVEPASAGNSAFMHVYIVCTILGTTAICPENYQAQLLPPDHACLPAQKRSIVHVTAT